MNGFLKIYTSSEVESQKDGYRNNFKWTIHQINGQYYPAFNIDVTGTTISVKLEELDKDQLANGIINVVSAVELAGLVTAEGNGDTYALRQAGTLTGLHRYKIGIDGLYYYSDIFFDVTADMPNYRTINEIENFRII